MKQHTKDDLGGAAFVIGLSTLFWLAFVIILGCSPALPNAPNARPTPPRIATPLSHTDDPQFFPGNMGSITLYPPAGQHFNPAGPVRVDQRLQAGSDYYGWGGSTCTLLGDVLVGKAGAAHPDKAYGGVIAARVTADSVTIWGEMVTALPAEYDYYLFEIQVGTVRISSTEVASDRPGPFTFKGRLTGCTVVGELPMVAEQAGDVVPEIMPKRRP